MRPLTIFLVAISLIPCILAGTEFKVSSLEGLGLPGSDSIVLPPPAGKKSEGARLLMVVPGARVPATNYVPVARSIQEHAKVNLWVVIVQCLGDLCVPNVPTTITSFDQALSKATADIKKDDFTLDSYDVFLSGHTIGVEACKKWLLKDQNKRKNKAAGILLLGTQFASTLQNPTLPTLTLSGELDGLSVVEMAPTYRAFRQDVDIDETGAFSRNAVLVLAGLNRSDFSPGYKVAGDLPSEVTDEYAIDRIGSVGGAWLDYMSGTKPVRKTALEILKAELRDSDEILMPAAKLSALEGIEWCKTAQKILSGLSPREADKDIAVNAVEITNTRDLISGHPEFSREGNRFTTSVISFAEYGQGKYPGSKSSTANEITCKCLSSDRFAEQLQRDLRATRTCADVNRESIALATRAAPKRALDRFKAMNRTIEIIPDDPTPGNVGPYFVLFQHLQLTYTKGGLSISSPALRLPLDSSIYPGTHYCKLISPNKVMEYIQTVGLRPDGKGK